MTSPLKKPRAKPRHIEDDLQRDVMTYLRAVLPDTVRAWHTPNGGKRNAREAARLKAQGVMPGVSDVLIMWNEFGSVGVACIELKAPKGTTSEAQKDFLAFANSVECWTFICRSVDDVKAALKSCEIPTKEIG